MHASSMVTPPQSLQPVVKTMCGFRESNPGPMHGKHQFYHYTKAAVLVVGGYIFICFNFNRDIFSYPLMSIFWETRFWRTGWRTKNGSRPQYLIGRFSWSFFLERLINPRPKMLPTVECWEGTVLCMARMCGTVKDFCKPIWELPVNATLY